MTKNAGIDKYGYCGYGIGFDRRLSFSFPSGGFGQNVLIFAIYMSSSAHIDNKKKNILILGKGPTQGLESVWAYIIMEQTVISLSMVQKFTNSKQKILKLKHVHYV